MSLDALQRHTTGDVMRGARVMPAPPNDWELAALRAEAGFHRRVRCEAYHARALLVEAGLRPGSIFDPPLTEAELDAAAARLAAAAREAADLAAA